MRKHSDERRGLVDLINKNGGFKGRRMPYDNPFNELALEGILEFKNPNAFPQQEYSFDSFCRDENDSVHRTHNSLSFSHINVQRDLKLATQLGGYSMRNRMQRVTRHKSDSGRRKKIFNILQCLPESYRPVKDHIIQYDLDKLTSICGRYKSSTVRKICLVMVEDRATSLGMYPPKDELLKIFDVQKSGLMKIKEALMNANMFTKVDRRIDSMKVAALNLLIELKDLGMIGKMQSLKAQSRIADLDQFPQLFNGSKHMDFVIAFAALMIDTPQLDLSTLSAEIEGMRGMESRKYYQAMRRAMSRSDDYVEYINSPVDVQTSMMGVAVDPQPVEAAHSVMVEPTPVKASVIEPEIVDIPEIINPIVEEIPIIEEIPIVEEVPVEIVKERDTDEFNVCWQSSDEITNGTWYSADTLSTYANDWYTYIPEGQNDPIEVEIRQRKSEMNFLYRNDYLIEHLLREGRRRQSDWHDHPLLVVHSPHVTMHGKGPPY